MFFIKIALFTAYLAVVFAQGPTTTPVPILKQINRQNDDGSYSFGFEAADGSFKIETKYPNGDVAGKYGYIDEEGKQREISYGAGSQRGFEPQGSGINVPPTYAHDPPSNALTDGQEDDGQYREDPSIYEDPKYNSRTPKGKVAPVQFSFQSPKYQTQPQQRYQTSPTTQPIFQTQYQAQNYNAAPTQAPIYNPAPSPSPIFRHNTNLFDQTPQTFPRPQSQAYHQTPQFSFQSYQPQQTYQSQQYQPQTYQPQTYQPQTYQPQTYQPQTYQQQAYNPQTFNPFTGHPAQNFDPSTGSYTINFTG